jgi:hypothetical protein
MDTPSGKYDELSEIKTRKLSKGEEAAYKTKVKPKEEGFYTVYANLYDDHGLKGVGMRLLNDDQISTSRNMMRSLAMQDKTEIVRPLCSSCSICS